MGTERFELSQDCSHTLLKRARIPVSPRTHCEFASSPCETYLLPLAFAREQTTLCSVLATFPVEVPPALQPTRPYVAIKPPKEMLNNDIYIIYHSRF